MPWPTPCPGGIQGQIHEPTEGKRSGDDRTFPRQGSATTPVALPVEPQRRPTVELHPQAPRFEEDH